MSQVQTRARADWLFLEVGQERGYLTPAQAAQVQAELERTGGPAEQVAERLGILSKRRVQRLQNHVRYKSLRQGDKAYAKAAVKAGLIKEADAEWALATQRERFERGRERLRVGSLLVERGALRPEQDRELAARITAELEARESGGSDLASGSSAVHEADSSLASHRGIEPAPVRAVQRDTRSRTASAAKPVPAPKPTPAPRARASSAAQPLPPQDVEPALLDSAADYEQACANLARRRITGDPPRERR